MESPYSQASFLSKLFFYWPNFIIDIASKNHSINLSDLPAVPTECDVFELYKEFKTLWKQEIERASTLSKTPSLAKVLLIFSWRKNGWISWIVLGESVAKIYQAVALGKFIGYLLNGNTTGSIYDDGYFLCFLIVLCGILVTLADHQFFFYAWCLGLQVKLIAASAIYEKSTTLHLRSLNQLPSGYGHIVNLCSQDVESFQSAGIFLHFLYQPVIESLGVLVVGLLTIGVSFLGLSSIL